MGGDPGHKPKVESFDGSSWTEGTDMNSGRAKMQVAKEGTTTASLVAGGELPGDTANAEIWNGTSWTEVGNLNTGRSSGGGAGGTTDAVIYGGDSPQTGKTESYDGSTWTEVADMGTVGNNLSGSGSATAAIRVGGTSDPTTIVAISEEWSFVASVETVAFD